MECDRECRKVEWDTESVTEFLLEQSAERIDQQAFPAAAVICEGISGDSVPGEAVIAR